MANQKKKENNHRKDNTSLVVPEICLNSIFSHQKISFHFFFLLLLPSLLLLLHLYHHLHHHHHHQSHLHRIELLLISFIHLPTLLFPLRSDNPQYCTSLAQTFPTLGFLSLSLSLDSSPCPHLLFP